MKVGKLILEGSNNCEDFEWEDLITELSSVIKKKNPNGYWHVEVRNFGWRRINGNSYFHITDGHNLITSILPNTECNFKIHNYGKGLAMQNYHYDNPTGNEWHYIKPISKSTYEKKKRKNTLNYKRRIRDEKSNWI